MIGLIVARSKNNVIGKNGNIPWKIKGEQKQFRELTTGNVVIMGRKSYEEIGHPLPNRMNIVVSTTTEYQGDNLVSVKSLEDALLLAKGRDVYISGGYGLFKEALQIVDKMYITEVDLNIEDGDTFFPEFDIKISLNFTTRERVAILSERIHELRMRQGYTQVSLAKKLGVSKQAVSNWENGNIQPSIDMLIRIADLFSVTTDYLLGREYVLQADLSRLPPEVAGHILLLIKDLER